MLKGFYVASLQTRLDWPDMGQAGGGQSPDCYSDLTPISKSGGTTQSGAAFWRTPVALPESVLNLNHAL